MGVWGGGGREGEGEGLADIMPCAVTHQLDDRLDCQISAVIKVPGLCMGGWGVGVGMVGAGRGGKNLGGAIWQCGAPNVLRA